MTGQQVDQLSQLLGSILARLDAIERWQHERGTAAEKHHTEMIAVITAQSSATQALTARIEDAEDDIAEMKPDIAASRDNWAQARGAEKLAVLLKGIAVTAIGAAAGWIGSVLHKG